MKLKTRTNQPVYYKLPVSSNIEQLSDNLLNSLRVGDVVQKKTGNQKHSYVVSYKEEKHGICLTYTDASVVETISYDYTDGHWVYNSKDVMPLGVDGIKNQDIQVNGITSKGIANTGGLANIGDVAISGNLNVQGEGKGIITCNELKEELDTEIIDISSYIKTSFAKSHSLYAKLIVKHNLLMVVVCGGFVAGASAGSNPAITENFMEAIPNSIKDKIYRMDGTNLSQASSTLTQITLTPIAKKVGGSLSSNSLVNMNSSSATNLQLYGYSFGTIAEDTECIIDYRNTLLL